MDAINTVVMPVILVTIFILMSDISFAVAFPATVHSVDFIGYHVRFD